MFPNPKPKRAGYSIQVKAFGLNRAELFTRQGESPGVTFPRVLGIEAVGTVEAAPGTPFRPGQKVAAMMGGMGRQFNGGYAQYTLVPQSSVFALETALDWAILGAIPEMFQTVMGSLTTGLEVQVRSDVAHSREHVIYRADDGKTSQKHGLERSLNHPQPDQS